MNKALCSCPMTVFLLILDLRMRAGWSPRDITALEYAIRARVVFRNSEIGLA